jgi:hypothetical protein
MPNMKTVGQRNLKQLGGQGKTDGRTGRRPDVWTSWFQYTPLTTSLCGGIIIMICLILIVLLQCCFKQMRFTSPHHTHPKQYHKKVTKNNNNNKTDNRTQTLLLSWFSPDKCLHADHAAYCWHYLQSIVYFE